ncbi:hypothetical protein MASR2M117_00430 [Paludibacter sp.]
MVKLRYSKGGSKKVAPYQKAFVYDQTAMQIVENARNIKWACNWFDNGYNEDVQHVARTFGDHMRDFETPALLMFGTDIITQMGEFYKDLIYGFDMYFTTTGGDSIAYIPDSVLYNARIHIEAAFNDSNYTEVYRLFNEAFTFLPLIKEE